MTDLRQTDEESCIVRTDVYNHRRKLNIEFLAGRTPIQALLQELPRDGKWFFRYDLDDEGHVNILFAMHQDSIQLLRMHPWLLLMDCTYKTNRFNMPLLDIVGFAPTGDTFYVAFAFLKDEKQPTYELALSYLADMYRGLKVLPNRDPPSPHTILTDKEVGLMNAITEVWPSTDKMLCLWHINGNVFKKADPLIKSLINDAIENDYDLPDSIEKPSPDLTRKKIQEEIRQITKDIWAKMKKR
jgi:hypothetical protein